MTPTRAADPVLTATLRGAWPSLPALLIASATLCAAATVPVLIAPGINPIGLYLYAVLCAPFLASLAALGNTIAAADTATIRIWAHSLRTHTLFAIRNALIPATAGTLFLAALRIWSRNHPLWMLPSLALTGTATVLTLLGFLAVLPLGITRPTLRGIRLWLTALHLVARRPTRFLAVLSLTALGLWTATSWTASLLLLLPAPATLVLTAAVWTTATELHNGAVEQLSYQLPGTRPADNGVVERQDEILYGYGKNGSGTVPDSVDTAVHRTADANGDISRA